MGAREEKNKFLAEFLRMNGYNVEEVQIPESIETDYLRVSFERLPEYTEIDKPTSGYPPAFSLQPIG